MRSAGPVGRPPRDDQFEDALRQLDGLTQGAPPPLMVVTDFDGTISMIDPDPLGARIEPLARVALRRLSRLAALYPHRLRLFVLSGRAALDVASRVRVGGLTYLGNHGLEGGALPARARAERLTVALDEALHEFSTPAHQLGAEVARRLGRPAWLFVEEKGPAVAFHFRAAEDGEVARDLVDRAVADAMADLGVDGFMRLEGRKVIEVRPALAGGKGATLERLLERERPGAVLALGDDVSDADAFRALAAARAEGRVAGLAIGIRGGAETPAAILEFADIVLASPHEAARLLSALARELERRLRPSNAELRPSHAEMASAVPVDVVTPAEAASAGSARPADGRSDR